MRASIRRMLAWAAMQTVECMRVEQGMMQLRRTRRQRGRTHCGTRRTFMNVCSTARRSARRRAPQPLWTSSSNSSMGFTTRRQWLPRLQMTMRWPGWSGNGERGKSSTPCPRSIAQVAAPNASPTSALLERRLMRSGRARPNLEANGSARWTSAGHSFDKSGGGKSAQISQRSPVLPTRRSTS